MFQESKLLKFPELEIDENHMSKLANDSFFKCAKNMKIESPEDFQSFFGKHLISELNTALIQINYTKYNNEQELLVFDQSTRLHLQIKLHVYILDEDGDEETLAAYLLVLNSNLETVDDFLW